VLKPGESKTLRFVFGYAKARSAAKIVAELIAARADRLEATAATWGREMPGLLVPESPWMDRELKWDYYAVASASLYDGYYQRHFIPQGGHYLYANGWNGATRDTAAYVQSLIYYRPEQAREILEFMMRSQERSGRLFYDLEGFGHRYLMPYRPSDLDLWFINAMTEYLFATRDFDFLDLEVPFYPKEKGETGTVYEHLRRSFTHLVEEVGIGKHGLVKLKFHDWNDEMVFLVCGPHPLDILLTARDGGSTLNTGMAIEILPRFAELAEMRGDMKSAGRARAWVEQLRPALREQWRGRYFNRAYSALGREYGADYIHLEGQIWPLLAGNVLTEEQTATLLQEIKTQLIDPSVLGMTISSTLEGKMFIKPGEMEEGGIWPAMNGPAMVALSRYQPGLAWQEFKKNSLAWHGEQYPKIWFGIWGGPDSWNSAASARPGETVKNPILALSAQQWPVMNTHSHCQWLWAAARLAGLNPTAQGYLIDPKIPGKFSFSSAVAAIAADGAGWHGSFRLQSDGKIRVRVKEPGGPYRVLAAGVPVEAKAAQGWIEFELPLQKDQPASWAVNFTP
jgi:cellobiose phosphorylase